MILYHGSNVEVKYPSIIESNRALDFGKGFYLTSDEEQAIRWAKAQKLRRKSEKAVVSKFEFDKEGISDISAKIFDGPNSEWLDYISANRKNIYDGKLYDIVIGPVANDNTMTVISEYIAGTIDKETAIILLKPQKLADQYAFSTKKALHYLEFKGADYYE